MEKCLGGAMGDGKEHTSLCVCAHPCPAAGARKEAFPELCGAGAARQHSRIPGR